MEKQNFIFQINKKNQKIIHIIDFRFNDYEGYCLEEIPNKFTYEGSIQFLPYEVGEKGYSIDRQNAIFFSGGVVQESMDCFTKVKINCENEKIRDILSCHFPLKGYKRVIWKATTNLDYGGITNVLYFGPLEPPDDFKLDSIDTANIDINKMVKEQIEHEKRIKKYSRIKPKKKLKS